MSVADGMPNKFISGNIVGIAHDGIMEEKIYWD
jgi:hypothetical protein